jgi:hypothetical protein
MYLLQYLQYAFRLYPWASKTVLWEKLKCSTIFTQNYNKTKTIELHGLSLQANYTNRATASCRRS